MQSPQPPVFRARISHGLEKIENFFRNSGMSIFGVISALLFSLACTYLIPERVALTFHELGVFAGALKAVERDVYADVTYFTKLVVIYFLLSIVAWDLLAVLFLAVVLFASENIVTDLYASLFAGRFFLPTISLPESGPKLDDEAVSPKRKEPPKFNTKFAAFKEPCCHER